jgi:putative flippase GtrA
MMEAAPRYLVVGITCAILHNMILIAGDFFGLHYIASSIISYAVCVLLGYGLHSVFTFGREMSAQSLFHYALGLATNLPGSLVLLFLFCDVAGIVVAIAAPATTAILFLLNFAMSHWVFARNPVRRRAV